jgi:VanZ family protein
LSSPRFAWTITALIVAGVGILSITPHPEKVAPVAIWDKYGHVLAYAALSLAVHRALAASYGLRGWLVLASVGLSVAYGVALEIVQYFVPPRQAEIADALANTIGAGIGSALAVVLGRRRPATPPPTAGRESEA